MFTEKVLTLVIESSIWKGFNFVMRSKLVRSVHVEVSICCLVGLGICEYNLPTSCVLMIR